MASQLWFTVFSTLAMAGAWWLLGRGGAAPPDVEREGVVFRYPVGVASLGWAFAVFGVVFLAWAWTALPIESAEDRWGFAMMTAFVAAPGLGFLAAFRREWARLTPDGIEAQGLFSSEPVRVRWADVERVSFGRHWGALAFRLADGRTVRVSGLFRGADRLAAVVGGRLADRGGAEAAHGLLEYRSQLGM